MTSKLVRFQVTLFVIVTIVGVLYAMINYVKLPQQLGIGRYTVSMELPQSGGLYPQANVSLRGVDVGQVKGIALADNGVRVTLEINNSVHIPRDARAEVRNTSAIGEQYVDLIPATSGGPYLPHGGTIATAKTSTPPQINSVLEDANTLVASVGENDLRTMVNQLYTGLNGNAVAIQRIIDATQLLVHAANDNTTPTTSLIQTAQQVLATQEAVSPNIHSYTGTLAEFTSQLVASDSAIRGTFAKVPAFANQITALSNQLQPILPALLYNLTAVGKVVQVYLPSVEQVLAVLPATNNQIYDDLATTPDINGQKIAKLDFKASVNNQFCTQGFPDAGKQRDPADLTLTTIPASAYCGANGTHPPATQDARGARTNQCPTDVNRRAATAAGCGLIFDTNTEADGTAFSLGTGSANTAGSASNSSTTAPSNMTTYDTLTGLALLPGGSPVILGDALPADAPTSWQSLFLNPLGIAGR